MRAYLRLDPNLIDHKVAYPDGAYRAFVDVLCLAEQQPHRGRFRNEKLLRVLLDKRARWVAYLVQHGDLIYQPDGKLYVDGWDEWQEGDWKVHERVSRIRNKKKKAVTPDTVTPGTAENVITPLSGGGKPLPAEAEAAHRDNGAPQTFIGFRPRPRKISEAERLADIERQHAEAMAKTIRKPRP